MKPSFALSFVLILLASGCASSTGWYQSGKNADDTGRDLGDCRMQAANSPVTTTRNLSGLGMFLNQEQSHSSYVNACMTSKGYQLVKSRNNPNSDPIEAKLQLLHGVIDLLIAYPQGGLIQGSNYTPAQMAEARTKLDADFVTWFRWCDEHPQGGPIPDGNGGVISVPANRVAPIRVELQKQFDYWKQTKSP